MASASSMLAPPRNGVPRPIRRLLLLAEHEPLMRKMEWAAIALFLGSVSLTYWFIAGQGDGSELISPPITAALLVANLIPAILLLVLLGRRIARNRAAKSAIGSNGRLHVRLVALFSLVASIPMLLVVMFASLLFQYGVEFWFSDRARGMLENANSLARGYYEDNQRDVGEETITMANDLRDYLRQAPLESPQFAEGYVFQVLSRKLNESAIVEFGEDGVARTAAAVDPDDRTPEVKIPAATVNRLRLGEGYVVTARPDRIEAVTLLDADARIFLYTSRETDMNALNQWERAQAVLRDYDNLFTRSRSLQLQFNIALFVVSLLIVGLALWIALALADRLVRPVGELVHAAKRVTEGDLTSRVPNPADKDEIGTLGRAFNRMTERLEMQTTALLTANEQLGSRREFIETVLESVTAGIISLDSSGEIRLVNSRAQALLAKENHELLSANIGDVAPEFADLLAQRIDTTIIQFASGTELLTLEVKVARGPTGSVITFEDITQQLLDQRRAAWSDVARRIAHEIKNPLTPIQLAAERLQRRFGKTIAEDDGVFRQLTGTIVRQVGDLRNIVDEFSSFARMPKPVFREEDIADLVKQAVFLQDIAQPDIDFTFEADDAGVSAICDRRQITQAVVNILKNAIEAIESRSETDEEFDLSDGTIAVRLWRDEDRAMIAVTDNGIGLPKNREQIVEPYMTTREKGTGLGLAIVKKIVEEHFGDIVFRDAKGQGAEVLVTLHTAKTELLADGASQAPANLMLSDEAAQ